MKIRPKITSIILLLIILSITAVSVINMEALRNMEQETTQSFQELGENATALSSEAMIEEVKEMIGEMAHQKGIHISMAFQYQKKYAQLLASYMTNLYNNQDTYKPYFIEDSEDKTSDNAAIPRLYYSSRVQDSKSPALVEEAGLIGNVSDILEALNSSSIFLTGEYITTTTGLSVIAHRNPKMERKQGGELLFNPQDESWYQGAVKTNDIFFTDIMQEENEEESMIVCGIPFYQGDTIRGVVGVGSYMKNINNSVEKTQVGERGYACVINQNGQVNFSGVQDGNMAVDYVNRQDLRNSKDPVIASLVSKIVEGTEGVEEVTIDGKELFVAYSKMDVIGWSFVMVLGKEEVLEPTKELNDMITMKTTDVTQEANRQMNLVVRNILVASLFILVIAIIVSIIFSRRISEPIRKLTREVQNLDGQNLDFQVTIHTKDEISILANSFAKMANELKEYIKNLIAVTAEKERIGSELEVATQIQADMLPRIFPAFPGFNQFDIYATMNPAKEVGGDFYDFFLINEKQLGIVIADVSGKGVPAALFMVIAKTLLRNQAQNGETPENVFYNVNNQLCEGNEAGLFVTAWFGIIDIESGKVNYVNAGHNPPLVKKKDETYQWLKCKPGLVLAGMENTKYHANTFTLTKGEQLFLYTDGIPEAMDENRQFFGEERLKQLLDHLEFNSLKKILTEIKRDIDCFVGNEPQFDDITMLMLRYTGCQLTGNKWELPAEEELLEDVLKLIGTVLEKQNCPEDVHNLIKLSVEEIFVNIAKYAYGDEEKKTVQIEVNKKDYDKPQKGIQIQFLDSGIPYNPLLKQDADISLSAEAREIGGLGIYMVKASMDHVRYEYLEGKNCLIMEKKWMSEDE